MFNFTESIQSILLYHVQCRPARRYVNYERIKKSYLISISLTILGCNISNNSYPNLSNKLLDNLPTYRYKLKVIGTTKLSN